MAADVIYLKLCGICEFGEEKGPFVTRIGALEEIIELLQNAVDNGYTTHQFMMLFQLQKALKSSGNALDLIMIYNRHK